MTSVEQPPITRETLAIDAKLEALTETLRGLESVIVCFSGGVDSAFVLAMAHRALGDRALGLTAVSPSLAPAEKELAAKVAAEIGAPHAFVESHEIDDPNYQKNAPDRCFHCKSELYRIAAAKREELGIEHVLNGTNTDDLGDYRPGLNAASDAGVKSPLVDLGFDKDAVRQGAKRIGLGVWDKPAAACLSSRIPFGTSVTRERLTQVGDFEKALSDLGFRQLRVRYHGDLARIELDATEVEAAAEPTMRERIVAAGRAAGFLYVTLDLMGYRTGSHNEALAHRRLRVVP